MTKYNINEETEIIKKIRNSGAEKYDRNEKLTRVLITDVSRQKSK